MNNLDMNVRRLTASDRDTFMRMSECIVNFLDNKVLLIPMTSEEADVTFSDGANDIVLGGFIDGKLVATLCLLHDISDYQELLIDRFHCQYGAEIGEAMVLPEYRRRGLMNQLWQELMKYIMDGGYDFIVATAHPDNSASNHLLATGGFKLQCVFNRRGYLRNMYLNEL